MLRECVVCGTIADMRRTAKTCSKECSKQRKLERMREWRKDPVNRERKLERHRERYRTQSTFKKKLNTMNFLSALNQIAIKETTK